MSSPATAPGAGAEPSAGVERQARDLRARDLRARDLRAREANGPALWDALWLAEGLGSWRGRVLSEAYARIEALVPEGSRVIDAGGGLGILARRLRDSRSCKVTIWDISPAAVHEAAKAGFDARLVDLEDLEDDRPLDIDGAEVLVATEVLEHLSAAARVRLLAAAASIGRGVFTVPNDRLGPEIEPQHTIQFNRTSLGAEMHPFFQHAHVEVVGPKSLFLLVDATAAGAAPERED